MEVKNWFTENGDETLALDWNLNEDSYVWEIGGFEGRWAQQIWDKFHCHITIFEPQLWAVEKMRERFKGNEDIAIHPYGLWTKDSVLPLGNYHTDGASLLNDDGRESKQLCSFMDVEFELSTFSEIIDMALMNIEGAEYTLIPAIIKSGTMWKFKNFWCQFHPGLISSDSDVQFDLTNEIFKQMNDTHDLLWNCYPTAVAWRRRG